MRDYELTYLVSDEVLEADLKKITDKVAGFISNEGGNITKEESWGRRKLAYPIAKQNFATYITVWFQMESNKLADLDHELRVYTQVIRHLTTLKVERAEVLKVTKEDIVETADVEKVIGEKSFEVVEGETEASKDLMAVREKDSDEAEELDSQEAEEDKSEKTEEIAETEVAQPKADQPIAEKKIKKAKAEKPAEELTEPETKEEAEVVEKKATKAKPSSAKATDGKEDEADRIKKLDEKLDELLGDDL